MRTASSPCARRSAPRAAFLLLASLASACGGGTPPVSVGVSPGTASVHVTRDRQFTASVQNAASGAVTWSVSGTGCAGVTCGTVTSSGLYTAPASVPNPPVVSVTATSVQDGSRSGSAAVTVLPPAAVVVSPQAASLHVGNARTFGATVQNAVDGSVTWSLSGSGCSGAACGTISPAGLYTAPSSLPSPAEVTVTATSVEDAPTSGSAVASLLPAAVVAVSPPSAGVHASRTRQLSATVQLVSDASVTWSVSGAGCSGAACGTVSSAGLYAAPATLPTPPVVAVAARSNEDPLRSAGATLTILPPVAVTVAPANARVHVSRTRQLTATVQNAADTAVIWSLSGTGCSGAACGTITPGGLYTAPASLPTPPAVTVTATSVEDPLTSGSAGLTILPPVVVAVAPQGAEVHVARSRQFTATLQSADDPSVTWSLSCAGAACGAITAGGLFTAPAGLPTPPAVTLTATSVEDPLASGSATATILPPVVVAVAPAIARVHVSRTRQLTATVQNATDGAVTWSLSGPGCAGAACGTITPGGLYAAPASVPTPPAVTATATSVEDPLTSGSATVTVLPPVVVTVSPLSATVHVSRARQLVAAVQNADDPRVTWSLSGAGCSGAACGAIGAGGLYAAPAIVPDPPAVTVVATSVEDPLASGSAVVTVLPPVVVTVLPAATSVNVSRTRQFAAAVQNAVDPRVTWSVSCPGGTCGSIGAAGLYTAPASVPSPATVTVTATSVEDALTSGDATATILPPVAVTVAPAAATVRAGEGLQLAATVQNAPSTTAVTWSVSGAGCTGDACGTITAEGRYTAPGTVPSPPAVSAVATSVDDPLRSGVAALTVVVKVSAWPAVARVAVGGQRPFGAAVRGSADPAVTWSLSGAGCSGAACGTVGPEGLYTAPATVPVPPAVSLTATAHADPAQSAAVAIEILPSDAAKLSGRYALLIREFRPSGPIGQVAAWFEADGAGRIVAGAQDAVAVDGVLITNLPFTGTYSVFPDDRGEMRWVWGGAAVVFRFVLAADGASGKVQPFYLFGTTPGALGSGLLLRQDPSAFGLSAVAGDLVVRLDGADAGGGRMAGVGVIRADGAGGITSGSLDVSQGGSATRYSGLHGSYTVDPTTGEGTAQIVVPGSAFGVLGAHVYVVSRGRSLFVSTDQPLTSLVMLSGEARAQSGGPFSSASLRGTGVLHLQGRPTSTTAEVMVGLLAADGAGAATGAFDRTLAGTTHERVPFTASYTVDAAGRGTITSAALPPLVFRLVSPGNAVLMGTGAPAYTGLLEPQEPGPYSAASLVGRFAQGSVPPAIWNTCDVTGAVTYDGAGQVASREDDVNPRGLLPDGLISGCAYAVEPDGRFTIPGCGPAFAYAVSPTRYVIILGQVPITFPEDKTILYLADQ